jgi:hypothetical protein
MMISCVGIETWVRFPSPAPIFQTVVPTVHKGVGIGLAAASFHRGAAQVLLNWLSMDSRKNPLKSGQPGLTAEEILAVGGIGPKR